MDAHAVSVFRVDSFWRKPLAYNQVFQKKKAALTASFDSVISAVAIGAETELYKICESVRVPVYKILYHYRKKL